MFDAGYNMRLEVPSLLIESYVGLTDWSASRRRSNEVF
jgi:hypothetical protein